jgi:hypothetical protein
MVKQFCMSVIQMTEHSRTNNEEFHTAVQRVYEAVLGWMFNDFTW